jgi:hypothetical protein
MLCNAYDDMTSFSYHNTRGVTGWLCEQMGMVARGNAEPWACFGCCGAVVWELGMTARAENKRESEGDGEANGGNMALQDGSWPCSRERGRAINA